MELNNIFFLILLGLIGYLLNKYLLLNLKKFNIDFLLDNQFNKPQAFHGQSTYRTGGILIFTLIVLSFLFLFFYKNILLMEYISFCTLFFFLGLIGISNGLANVLGSSTWAEIYGVKYIGSIKALTTALMVFSTAFGTALFGILIDKGFSIEQIYIISGIYISFSIIALFFIRNKLNPMIL